MITATPTLAATPMSRITWMGINTMVMKPNASDTSAVIPGTYSARKARRALFRASKPAALSRLKALITCTP